MIGGLQGDFGDLDNKYLRQNISKYPKMSVANIKKLQENTTALCRMAALPSDVRIPDVESARQPGANGGAHPSVNGGSRV